jgi:hypothetical protein
LALREMVVRGQRARSAFWTRPNISAPDFGA